MVNQQPNYQQESINSFDSNQLLTSFYQSLQNAQIDQKILEELIRQGIILGPNKQANFNAPAPTPLPPATPMCPKCKHFELKHTYQPAYVAYKCRFCSCIIPDFELARRNSMPNYSTDAKLRQSYVRLKPAMDEIKELVFYNKNIGLIFFGSTVRDSIAGGLVNNYNIHVGVYNSDYFGTLMQKDISARFPRLESENDEKGNFLGKYSFKSKFGDKTFEIWTKIPSPNWSVDRGFFDGQYHTNIAWVTNALTNKKITLFDSQKVNKDNYETVLKEGAQISVQYGLTIDEQSLAVINRIVDSLKPLEMFNETIYGFRSFKINRQGKLQGFYNAIWETAELEADCPDFRDHIKAAVVTDGGSAQTEDGMSVHGCGIYIYKDLMECIMNYQGQALALCVLNGGDFWEGERGFRAEKVRIEKLWVFKGATLNPTYEVVGGVMVDVSRTDAIKDILGLGLNIDTSNTLL